MTPSELLQLSVSELGDLVEAGEVSPALAVEALAGEIAGKNRKTAIELYQSVIDSVESVDEYVVANKTSIIFKAGIKSPGEAIDLNWPEYLANENLLNQHIELKLVVKK